MLSRSKPMNRGTGFKPKASTLKQGSTLKATGFKPKPKKVKTDPDFEVDVEVVAVVVAVVKIPRLPKTKRKNPSGADPEYMGRVAALGCRICRLLGFGFKECEVHHQRTGTGGGKRAPDRRTVGLCYTHHRGEFGIHHMGRKRWERHFGVTEVELVEATREELGIRDES